MELDSFDKTKLTPIAMQIKSYCDEMRFYCANTWNSNFKTIKNIPKNYSGLDKDAKMKVLTNLFQYLGSIKEKVNKEYETFKSVQKLFSQVKERAESDLTFENASFFMGEDSDVKQCMDQLLSDITGCGAQFSGQLKKSITGKFKLSDNEFDAAKASVAIANLENGLFEFENAVKETYEAFEKDVVALKERGFSNVDTGKVVTPLRIEKADPFNKDSERKLNAGNIKMVTGFEKDVVGPYMDSKLQKEIEEIKKENKGDEKELKTLNEKMDGGPKKKPKEEEEDPFELEGKNKLPDDLFKME